MYIQDMDHNTVDFPCDGPCLEFVDCTTFCRWHADVRLVGTSFSRSHMSCFQSVGNAKPNGEQSTQYMQLVQVQIVLGMDPPERVCVSVCVFGIAHVS